MPIVYPGGIKQKKGKKMKNKKGSVEVMVVNAFLACVGATAIASFLMIPQNVQRRSVEKCIHDGGSVNYCSDKIASMNLDQRKEYIRDK